MDVMDKFKWMIALVGGVLGWIFGSLDFLFYVLVTFVAIDYISGVLLAIYERKVSSDIGYKGITKKVMIFLLVAVGNLIDQYLIGSGSSLKTMIIMFYTMNEGISIIENAGKMGMPLPQKLKDILTQLQEK
jgi:toxin secretion/phage lysis holin